MTDDPGEREAEKERLAQALRDGDMETFTAAVRKVNRPMSTRDIEHERRRMTRDLGSPDPVSEPVDGLERATEVVRDGISNGRTDEEIARQVLASDPVSKPVEHDSLNCSDPHCAYRTVPVSEPVDGLREAAQEVVRLAETDDDFEGSYTEYLVPADALDALRAALAAAPAEDLRAAIWAEARAEAEATIAERLTRVYEAAIAARDAELRAAVDGLPVWRGFVDMVNRSAVTPRQRRPSRRAGP